ncbi:DUF11 domain-containing protein [Tahibacter caeni]|uniref:DUF11 domain-containing protein n=1 Tax=Tahibacter caeni TaxID=1453545 RepID=UPI002148D65C
MRTAIRRCAILVLVYGIALLAAPAHAAITVNKTFTPATMTVNGTSTVTVTLGNTGAAAATGVAFTDNLPAGLVVANPANAATTCGGTVAAAAGASSFSLSGASIASNGGTCNVTVPVTAGALGSYTNIVPAGGVTSSQGSNGSAASASLAVVASTRVTGTIAYAPAGTVLRGYGSPVTATITLNNANTMALTNVSTTFNLQAALQAFASPANLSSTCGPVTLNTAAGTGTLSGGTIPANGSCTITFDIVEAAPNTATNTTSSISIAASNLTSAQGITNNAISGAISTIAGGRVAKSFSPVSIASGETSTLTLRLDNLNAAAIAPVDLVDALPAGMTIAPAPAATNGCGGTLTATAGSTSIQLSGGSLAASPATGSTYVSCTITVKIVGTTGTSLSNLLNTVPAGTWSGVGYTGSSANLAVTPTSVGSVVKSFSPTSIAVGGTSTLTLELRNYTTSTNSPIGLTDTFPSGLTVAALPNVTNTCGGSVTAAAGAGSVQLSGGSLAAAPGGPNGHSSCKVTVAVTAAAVGSYANTIPAGNWNGVPYAAAAATLTVSNPFAANKSINGSFGNITMGGSNYVGTITLVNNTTAPMSLISVTDDLATMGTGFTVAATPAPATTCAGGTLNAPAGGTSVVLTGGTIPASGSCTIKTGLHIPIIPGPRSIHTNTIPAGNIVTSAGSNATPVTAAVWVVTPLRLSKSFSPGTLNAGGTATLTIVVNNGIDYYGNIATGVDALTNISGADILPAGMVVATPSQATTTCTGATITAPAGGSTIGFSGMSLNGGASCSISIGVAVPAGTPPGTLANVIPTNSVTTDQGITNSDTWAGDGTFRDGRAGANLTVISTDVTIGKSFSPATVSPSTPSQMQIQLVNSNPNNTALSGAAFSDPLPAGMAVATPPGASLTGCTGTITATAGSSTVALSGASIAAGATCTLRVNVVGTAAGNLINTIPANALTTTQGVTNTGASTATLAVTGTADLSVTKTDNQASVATGTTTTYTVVVGNAGPNNVIGATVADTPPAGMTITGWTCSASAGASCGAASGSGPIDDTININTGATVTYTVQASVAPGFAGASITNSAAVTPPSLVSDPNPGNNTASDTDTVVPGVVLALTKSDGSGTYTPGGTATYTVTVANTGPAGASQVDVSDALPAGVTLTGNVTCTPGGAATCGTVIGSAGQTSFSATGATIPAGAANALTFSMPVAFAPDLTTDPLVNAVTANDAVSGAAGSASDSDARSASADVSVVKSGPASVVPGGPIRYTVTIANAGPSAANGTTFSDTVPAAIAGVAASCGSASGGAACPASVTVAGNTVSGAVPTLPPGGSVVITIDGQTSASAGTPIANTATAAPPSGTTDPAGGNDTSTWTTNIKPVVGIDKTVDATSVVPGATVHYTITVTNPGPVAADGTAVTDPIPNGIASQTWTCAGSGGAVCPNAAGSGAIAETIATFPAASAVVYTVTATVSPTPPANINNTATATPPNGVCAPANTPPPCADTASLPPVPQIGVSKTADATAVTPGGTIHYAIVVSNTGVLAADGTPVSDPMPAGIASQTWICSGSGGATCAASGAGAISDVIATFPAGSFVTYTVTAIVDAAPPAVVSNTVTATPPNPGAVCTPDNTPGPCTATANVTSNAQIRIAKTASTNSLVPGGSVTYTITVTNTGAVAADGTTVDDPVPTGIASQTWTCAANAGAACTAAGTGAIVDTLTAFPPGSFVTYTVTAVVAANPPGTVTNVATATPPPGGICTPGNTPPPCDSAVTGGALPQIRIAKTADTSGPLTPGGTITYTVTVTNAGSADAPGTVVSDPLPAGIGAAAWTCAASGGAVCPNASGTGGVSETLATFPSGGTVVYTIAATVAATPPARIDNTASATPASGVCLPGNTAPPCTSTVGNGSAPQIAVSKTADDASYVAGGVLHWTVTVTNTGSAAADGTTVGDPLPAGIVSSAWTCLPGGGAVCANANGTGAIAESIPTFPPGATVTYAIAGTVATPAPASIANTVAATPPAGGTCAPGNTAPPCTATATTSSAPDVAIAKSVADANGNGVAEPGEPLTYTILVSNAGGSAATNVGVTDPLDPNLVFVSASNGGTLSGTTVSWSGLTVPAGGNVALTLVATVASPLAGTVREIANVAYRTGTAAAPCPPAGPQCAVLPTPGAVTLAKSVADANADGIADPGETLTYTILLSGAGGGVSGYGVTDPLDPNLVFVSADNGGVLAGGAVTWTNLTVPAGGSLALTVVATVADPLPGGVTSITNLAYETGTPVPACPPAGPHCVVLPTPGAVTIAKSVADASGNGIAQAGESLTYTIVVANAGSTDVTNYGLTDRPDPNVSFVSASNGGLFAGGAVTWSGLTIPANGSLTLTVVTTVADPLPGGIAAITNVAYPTGTTPPDCTAAPTPPNCAVIAAQFGTPQLLIRKTVNLPASTPGGTLVYTVSVSNVGTAAVTNAVIGDPLAPGIASYAWTCAASGGAACPQASGAGAIAETIANLPPGGAVVYTVTAQLAANPPPAITNVADVTSSGPSSCAPSGTPPPCTSQAVVTVVAGGSAVVPVPVGSHWMLWLMAVLLAGIGIAMRPRRRT